MSKKQMEWKLVRGSWISKVPILPGVWRRKDGGHVVRARAVDARSGRMKEIWKSLPDSTPAEALAWIEDATDRVRKGLVEEALPKVHFATYALSLMKRKIADGDIVSAAGVDKWMNVIARLIQSNLGELYVSEIRTSDVLAWKASMAKKISNGTIKPTTANTWLAVLKVILKHAKLDFGLRENAATDVSAFDVSRHRPYTHEEPNSLTAAELRKFLEAMRELYPQHFAMTFLGFATGLRPSSLRPLRRKGESPDVLWDEGKLLIRQSQTRRDEVMVGTKTAKDQTISVPAELMDVLRWHVDTQIRPGPQEESDLLFASEVGGFRAPSVLDKPFRDVCKKIELKKTLTPRGMRRSFQDLARAAEVRDIVTRSISGHATESMQQHYSTVSAKEQSKSLSKVLRLMDFKQKPKKTAAAGGAGRPSTGKQGAPK